MSSFIETLYALYPQVVRTVGDDAFDIDGNPVVYDRAAVEETLNATQYQRQRASEYPSMAAFADAYYWAQKGDNTKMDEYVAACDAVKAKYPKPE